jgi:hypothetical protein
LTCHWQFSPPHSWKFTCGKVEFHGEIQPVPAFQCKNLKEILDGKKKKVTNHKRKQKNEEVVVERKGKEKEKAKAKKAEEGSKKKAGSKKSHQKDD